MQRQSSWQRALVIAACAFVNACVSEDAGAPDEVASGDVVDESSDVDEFEAVPPGPTLLTQGQSLANPVWKMDTWVFNCPASTNRGQIRIHDLPDLAAAPAIYAFMGRSGFASTTSVDTEAGSWSAWATGAFGAGRYVVAVHKNADGVDDYELEARCLAPDNSVVEPAALSLMTNQ